MADRRRARGSVYQRSSDGRWVGAIDLPRGLDGKRRRTHVVCEKKADVLDALDELRRHIKETGDAPDKSTTVAEYLDYYVRDVVREVTESTRGEYRKRIARMVPLIGHFKLIDLTTPQVRKMVARLDEKYSPKTVSSTLETLRAALEAAIEDGILTKNVAKVKSLRRRQRIANPDDTLSASEVEAVLAAAASTDIEALVYLALKYGLRIGELLQLRWDDIDLDARTLTVRRFKTDAGARTIPLIDQAVDQLERQAKRSVPVGWVFPSAYGRQRSAQVTRNEWNRVLAAAGVEHRCRNCGTKRACSTAIRRFHASRHTAATLLLSEGHALEVVSAILGHSSIRVTSDVYARVSADLMRQALEGN